MNKKHTMEVQKTEIPLNYTTIKITSSRVDKSLLAIPKSLIDWFPKESGKIFLVGGDGVLKKHTFTAYSSSSRECRIGGMRTFFTEHQIHAGDELVLQKFDNNTFRLIPEKIFNRQYQHVLLLFEKSEDEENSQQALLKAEKIANVDSAKILENEFIKLSSIKGAPERKITQTSRISKRESVPPYLRKILQSVYEGKCQLTQFTFIMRNGNPYFEIHHIKPEWGNHIKNLLVVCPNVHKQFTYMNDSVASTWLDWH